MNKIIVLFFISLFQLTHSMDNQDNSEYYMLRLPEELRVSLFDIQVNQAVEVCKPDRYNDQKNLILYVLAISQVNKYYRDYINSSEYIKNCSNQFLIMLNSL